jgi:hypothetical protein
MTQRHFFALPDDLLGVFKQVEARRPVSFVLTGLFETAEFAVFHSGAELPTLRSAASRQSVECPTYLVMPASASVNVRPVPQRKGGVRYAIDQLDNPDTTTLTHGGLHTANVLISGRVATVSTTPIGRQLQAAFSNAIGKLFGRVNAFYVGPRAMELLRGGCRLTQNALSPAEYDLQRPRASA